jgi:hypothetical protein
MEGLAIKDAVKFYGHFVYFTAIWCTLCPSEILYGYFGLFLQFWYVVPRKIWQPWFNDASRSCYATTATYFPCRSIKKNCVHSLVLYLKNKLLLLYSRTLLPLLTRQRSLCWSGSQAFSSKWSCTKNGSICYAILNLIVSALVNPPSIINLNTGLPDFSWSKIPKWRKYTKLPQNIPNDHKVFPMAVK